MEMTTAYYNGEELELAKYTLKVAEEFDKVNAERATRVKAEKMYRVLSEIVGADTLAEIVDGNSYDTCDITILVDLYNAVDDAYASDMNRYKDEKVRKNMEMVSDMGGKIDQFTSAVNKVGKTK